MTWPRHRAAGIVGVLAGSLVLAGLAGEASGWPFLQLPLRDALQRAVGVPVQLEGRFRVHLLWRPRLLVERLTVGSAAGVPAPHLVDGRQVAIAWHWGDVWRWRRGGVLVLRSMRADALDVHLVRLADGRASWQIGRAREADAPARPLPKVGWLEVDDGHITIVDQLVDTQLRIDVRGREGGGSERQASDGYRADISGRYRASPIKLALSSGGALPLLRDDEDGNGVTTTSLRVDGEVGASHIVFDGQAAALMGGRHLDGALRFSGPSLAWVGEPLGLALPQTPAFNLQGRLTHHDGVWTLRADRATIGRSELAGDFLYDTTTRPARLSGRLAGPRLLLADLGPSIGAPTGGSAELPTPVPRAPRSHVLPQQRFNVPSMRAMDADVQVAIDQLVFSTSAVNPLHDLRTHLLLDDGVLELRALKANVAGGRLSGSTRLDGRHQPARWAAKLRFDGVDVAGWVRGVRTPEGQRKAPAATDERALRQQREAARRGEDKTPTAYLTGQLEAVVDVTGTGQSTAEILSTLDGPVQVTLRDGTMSHLVTEAMGLDAAQALGVVIKGDAALPLRCARLDFTTDNGVMRLARGVFDNPDTTIRVAGQLDWRNEQLAMVARARPKDISPVSLRAPVIVTGTLSAPVVSIEPSRLAARALGAVALGVLAGPLAAVIPLVDLGEREQGDPCAVPAAAASAASARQAATQRESTTR